MDREIEKALFEGELGQKTEVGMEIEEVVGFLKVEDVKEEDILTILDAGKITESRRFANPDGSPKKQYNFLVELPNGLKKTMSFNKSTRVNLVTMFGKDTNNWVGKKAEVTKNKSMNGKEYIVLKGVEILDAEE